MRLHTRLNAVDGKVLCPHDCAWKELEKCAACTELREIAHGEQGDTVVCEPTVNVSFDRLLDGMIRGGNPIL